MERRFNHDFSRVRVHTDARAVESARAVGALALASGQPPPAGAQPITENNWNAPTWVEQPLSHYSVAGGPAEDFAEAVMTFVHQPNLLVSRSPHRFAFINSGKDVWLPQLLRLPLVGDFPQPRGKDRAA